MNVRKLTATDLDFADQVRALAGWNQTRADWMRFIAKEPNGCFLAEIDDRPAGTATTICYGDRLGWIGMVLVHPDHRRRGVATVLMNAALDYLHNRVRCIKLDATPEGQKVYERLGFRAEWELCRWVKQMEPAAKTAVLSANPFLDIDAEIFGADRRDWLTALAADASYLATSADAMGMIRSGSKANYIGPVTAATPSAGCQLMQKLFSRLSGETYWDVPEPNTAAVELAHSEGFTRMRPLLRMWTGQECVTGRPELQFAIGDPATG